MMAYVLSGYWVAGYAAGDGGADATSLAITLDSAVFSGSAVVSPVAAIGITTDSAAFAGSASVSAAPVNATLSTTTDSSVFSGGASVSPRGSLGIALDNVVFLGSAAGYVAPSTFVSGAITRPRRIQTSTRHAR